MSVRPIEFQVSIPKTFEASKEQQNFLKRSDLEAQQKAISGNEEVNKKMTSVNDSEKAEKRDLKNDSEGGGKNNSRNDSNKNKDKEAKSENISICFDPGKLDIKI